MRFLTKASLLLSALLLVLVAVATLAASVPLMVLSHLLERASIACADAATSAANAATDRAAIV